MVDVSKPSITDESKSLDLDFQIFSAISLLQIQLCLSDTILWSNIGPIILVQRWSNNSSCLVCCIKQEYMGIYQLGLILIPTIIVHLLDYKAL